MLKLGVIGYGGRIRGVLEEIYRLTDQAVVTAITDTRIEQIREELTTADQNAGRDIKREYFQDADEMLDATPLDGVLIGTRCSLHARMAVKVLKRNLPLYLEKPVATNMDDLVALRDAGAAATSETVVSFPLRVTPLVRVAKEIIDSGQLGTIEHVQAWNNVPYGAVYYQDWYRDENETQGLFLQKATHDFDYINYLLGYTPVTVAAMNAKQIMKGDMPAGQRCADCPKWETCLESPYHNYVTKQEAHQVRPNHLMCCFAVDTGNEDSGSALVQYHTGMHVSYTQNFFVRKSAGIRGARLMGYKGTLEFDWYTDTIKVIMHHAPRVETIHCPGGVGHGGGDTVLADSFVRILTGRGHSAAPLDSGLISCLICLKAKESARTQTFQSIVWPDQT